MAAQQAQLPAQAAPAAPAAAPAAPAGMPPDVAAGLREIGAKIEGAKTTALYAPLHAASKHDAVELRRDQVYGPHERHRADVFLPKKSAATRPLVVFLHGGGFSRGAKNTTGQFYYDNIGYWAAEHGLVGVTINYRLSPEFQYPSGARTWNAWSRGRANMRMNGVPIRHASSSGGIRRVVPMWRTIWCARRSRRSPARS